MIRVVRRYDVSGCLLEGVLDLYIAVSATDTERIERLPTRF